jgi:hypothetical protein
MINQSTGAESLFTLRNAVDKNLAGKPKGLYTSINKKLSTNFKWSCKTDIAAGEFNYGKSLATDEAWEPNYDA